MDQQEAIRALYLEGKTIRDRNQGSRTYRFDPSSGNVVNQAGETELVCFSPDVEWTAVDTAPLKVGDVVKDCDGVRARVVYVDDEASMIREEVSRARRFIFHRDWLAGETRWTNQGEEKETEGSPHAKGPEWLRLGDKLVNKRSGAKATVTCIANDEAVITTTGEARATIKKHNWMKGCGESYHWRREPAVQQMREDEAEVW